MEFSFSLSKHVYSVFFYVLHTMEMESSRCVLDPCGVFFLSLQTCIQCIFLCTAYNGDGKLLAVSCKISL